ncbi:hypothetical protein GCM10010501_67260 [Streptomyces libani subsp. rufus]|nr:hypothetical protein GCM10010501_67260 [Streptomyces libani subsp. rufus]
MEAGPRDTAQSAEHLTTEGDEPEPDEPRSGEDRPRVNGALDAGPPGHALVEGLRPDGPLTTGSLTGSPDPAGLVPDGSTSDYSLSEDRLAEDGPNDIVGGVTADGPEPEEMYPGGPEVEVELRPQRRLRIWQLAPIVGLAAVGSLMFAFPLAFDFGDSGAVIAMLGLLICSCAAGWGMMAARRVGYTWPGLPPRGSGRRPDWRVVLGYVLLVAVAVVLAVWRVARLR